MKATLALVLMLTGCGAQDRSAFSYHFSDNQAPELAGVLTRLPAPRRETRPQNALHQPIAVATTHGEENARQIVAMRVDTGARLWSAELAAATQPEILGDVVIATTREQIVAYDLRRGTLLWRAPLPDLAYVGATRDGDRIVWAATVGALGGARRVGHIVAVNARTGAGVWRHEIEGVFGKPATAGGLVFVPWERQNIAILDGRNGVELTRLRSTDDVISWAFEHPSGVYYGSRGIYRLTERSASGTRTGSAYLRPPLGELPRQPESIWPDGFLPLPGTRSARGRIRVYFTPAPNARRIDVEGGTYYFVYYRYVFALDREGALRWTRILEQDVINAQALPNGLLVAGEHGRMNVLDRETGNDRWMRDAPAELASIALDAAGFDPQGAPAAARPLRQSLNEVVLDPDNRLVPARAYAVAQLARIEDAEVTRDLLDLYQQRSMPRALQEAIREALRTRRSGEQYLMEALARRYDYLEDTQAPPLEAIVPALLEMRYSQAVPQLVSHMMDHETPAQVLPQVVDAIVRLGGADAVPALRAFLVLYQSDSAFAGPVADQPPRRRGGEPTPAEPLARALAIAAAGIFEHGGSDGRALLASLSAQGSRMHQPIARHIAGLYVAERTAAERARQNEEQAAAQALAERQRQEHEALPARLTQQQVNQTFADNADPVRECIAGELERNPQLSQVRMLFVLSGEGAASELTVAPSSSALRECLGQRVAQIGFPHFRQRRMRASFTVTIRGQNRESAQPGEPVLPSDAPWWAWVERRSQFHGMTPAIPAVAAWWTERAAPARRAAPTVQLPAETEELPPGMTAPTARRPPARTPQPARPAPTPQEPVSAPGTPWWAAAASEDEEEAPPPQQEVPPTRPAPRRAPRRPQ